MAERWVRTPGRRSVRRRLRRMKPPSLVVWVCLLLVALGSAAEAAAEAHGHSLDPTDSANFNTYALRNDSTARLYVRLCADTRCAKLDSHVDWVEVEPRSADDEQVYWGDTKPTVYAVAGSPHKDPAQRCLVLDASKKASATVDAPLSSARACRATAG